MMWCTASLARSFSIHWLAVVMFGSRVSCEKERRTCWIAELKPHAKRCNFLKLIRRWAPISSFTFMQKSFSYVHNCSVQPHYFSVDWADRVICSAIPHKKQVFSHVCVWQKIHKQNFYIVITPWRLRPPVASTEMYRQPWLCDFYCTIFLVSYCLCNVRWFGSLQFFVCQRSNWKYEI